MKRLIELLEIYFLPVADKLGKNRHLNSLRNGFMLSFPLSIFGSVFVVIANLPFLHLLMSDESLSRFKLLIQPAVDATLMLTTLTMVIGFGYYLLRAYGGDGIFGGSVALTSFLLLTPIKDGVLPVDVLGAKGMFVGIISTILSIEIYRRISARGWLLKLPATVPPPVEKSFSAVIPTTLTLLIFLIIRIVFGFSRYTNVHNYVYELVQRPLIRLGGGLTATLIAVLFIQTLWFFGLHGQIIINSVLDPIWNIQSLQNLEALASGDKLSNIINKQFIEIYTVGMGGTGMTLPVVFAMIFIMKSKRLRQTGKLSAPAGIFNVNEPIIFGLPIVMNLMIIIPWIVAPMVVVVFTYFMMASGIIPLTSGANVPWTLPIFFSGMLSTNSIRGGLLQIINFFIVLIIWLPFLKALDNKYLVEEGKELNDEEKGMNLSREV